MCGRFIHNIKSYMTFTSFLLLLPRCQMTETLLLRRTPLISQSIIQSLCPLFFPSRTLFSKEILIQKAPLSSAINIIFRSFYEDVYLQKFTLWLSFTINSRPLSSWSTIVWVIKCVAHHDLINLTHDKYRVEDFIAVEHFRHIFNMTISYNSNPVTEDWNLQLKYTLSWSFLLYSKFNLIMLSIWVKDFLKIFSTFTIGQIWQRPSPRTPATGFLKFTILRHCTSFLGHCYHILGFIPGIRKEDFRRMMHFHYLSFMTML